MRQTRAWRNAALVLLVMLVVPCSGGTARQFSPIDLVDLEVAYDTLESDYYRHVDPQRIIDGARTGLLAYLRGRGIATPRVTVVRANGRYAHDLHAAGQEVADAILRYGARVDPDGLVYAAIAGEAASVRDPYTVFFTPEQERAFYRYLNPNSFGGIGVIVRFDGRHGAVIVDDVIAGGPAEKAGIRAGDWIWEIDGVPTAGASADAVGKRLRGKAGSAVQLTYGHGESGAHAEVRIVRANVTPPDATGRLLPGGVAYLQLRSYGATAGEQVETQVRRLWAQAARGFVLDLRGNGGGYRDAAVAVTARFVPAGPVVVVQARSGKRTTLYARDTRAAPRPLAVLVNGDTASAAEITAGAIQDTKSGVLVGTRTFGKGLVQQMFPLPDGAALKVTVERYYTAHGRDIDRKGIDPDVVVEQPADSIAGDPARDPQLARAIAAVAPAPSPSP